MKEEEKSNEIKEIYVYNSHKETGKLDNIY
jgi:hypothetical protein